MKSSFAKTDISIFCLFFKIMFYFAALQRLLNWCCFVFWGDILSQFVLCVQGKDQTSVGLFI